MTKGGRERAEKASNPFYPTTKGVSCRSGSVHSTPLPEFDPPWVGAVLPVGGDGSGDAWVLLAVPPSAPTRCAAPVLRYSIGFQS